MVSQAKYNRYYKMAKNIFKKDMATLQDELLQAFKDSPKLKEKFLSGDSVEL